jgi:NIMA (never in mitosis gene a)-related kinase
MSDVRLFTGKDPNYKYLGELGVGSFGVVTKVRRKTDKKILACKSIDRYVKDEEGKTVDMLLKIRQEAQILRNLDGCRTCVQFDPDISYDEESHKVHLHTEYYSDGSLTDLIDKFRNSGEKLPEHIVIGILEDLVQALYDCHGRGILHRDIKPDNILLDKRYSPKHDTMVIYAVLVDFGLGKITMAALGSIGIIPSGRIGTYPYMAPEYIDGNISQKSDIFSLGCVLYEMCMLRRPYKNEKKTTKPLVEGDYSTDLKSLIRDCMAINPSNRINTETLRTRFQLLPGRQA